MTQQLLFFLKTGIFLQSFKVSNVVTSITGETMPAKCVVFGCNNVQSEEKGLLLHPIPFYGKSESEKQKQRKKWVDFVKSRRAHWQSTVCSKHFTEEDYTNRFADDLVRRLKRDGIDVCVLPTRHAPCVSSNNAVDKPESYRSKRKVRHFSSSDSLLVKTS